MKPEKYHDLPPQRGRLKHRSVTSHCCFSTRSLVLLVWSTSICSQGSSWGMTPGGLSSHVEVSKEHDSWKLWYTLRTEMTKACLQRSMWSALESTPCRPQHLRVEFGDVLQQKMTQTKLPSEASRSLCLAWTSLLARHWWLQVAL